MRAEFNVGQDVCVIIHVSRMNPEKGHAAELKALQLIRFLPNWVLWVVGGPQDDAEQAYFGALTRMASQLGIGERIQFMGQRQDVQRLLGGADIFLHVNAWSEPFGIALVEALYAGLPVVASTRGATAEIVDDTCGVLVDPNDISGLAAVLRSLIEDTVLRRRLAAGGLSRAIALCEPRKQMRRIAQVLSEIPRRGRSFEALAGEQA